MPYVYHGRHGKSFCIGDMVDRVARAMALEAAAFKAPDDWDGFAAVGTGNPVDFFGIALAAIAAMREPTPEIIEAGMWDGKMDAYCPDGETAKEWNAHQWRDFIDAALEER